MPKQTQVAIIGGGIIGVSTAMYLAQRGIPVALFEKGHLAGEQSSRNWGWCRQTGRDSREMPLILESLRIWPTLNEITGHETGFRPSGVTYVAENETKIANYEKWAKIARDHDIDARILSADETTRLAPGFTGSIKAGLTAIGDGRAEPQKAVPALAQKAMADGAVILENCAVRGIETTNSKVSAVITEHGRVECQAVVIAGGAWSRLICRSLGQRLPQLLVRSSVLRTTPIDAELESALYFQGFALRKRLDGGYTIASDASGIADIVPDSFRFFRDYLPTLLVEWRNLRLRFGARFFEELFNWHNQAPDQISVFEKFRTLDPHPHLPTLRKAMLDLRSAFPVFEKAGVAQQWAGLIDTMPDVIPVISPLEGIEGAILATGFSGHGFGIGPGAGRLIADMVMNETPLVDPSPFRLSRFNDGSKIEIEKWG